VFIEVTFAQPVSDRPAVLFVCVHNASRSQIAAASSRALRDLNGAAAGVGSRR
jgi:protein-tyrosine-phosphatase